MSINEFTAKVRRKINGRLNRQARKKWSHIDRLGTLFFNLRCFDLRTALKCPVYIYNHVDVININKVIIDAPSVSRGMIRIGNWPMKAHNNTKLHLSGTIIFHGQAEIWGGCILEGGGILELGDNTRLAESCKVMCIKHIKIGDNGSIGYETTIMDTDYHFVLDTQTLTVHPNTAEVIIGDGTWISSTCKIMKGTILPPNSVVSGGSLVNHDFSSEDPCQVYIGTPAKPVKKNRRRIFNKKIELEITKYFNEHPSEKTFKIEAEDLDDLCYSFFLRNPVDLFG